MTALLIEKQACYVNAILLIHQKLNNQAIEKNLFIVHFVFVRSYTFRTELLKSLLLALTVI